MTSPTFVLYFVSTQLRSGELEVGKCFLREDGREWKGALNSRHVGTGSRGRARDARYKIERDCAEGREIFFVSPPKVDPAADPGLLIGKSGLPLTLVVVYEMLHYEGGFT